MQKVDIYWNLHKSCFSIRDRDSGKVTAHAAWFRLENARFIVQPAGRQRVLETRRKAVHAFIRGELSEYGTGPWLPVPKAIGFESLAYNPFKGDSFYRVTDGHPLESARVVLGDSCQNLGGKRYPRVAAIDAVGKLGAARIAV